MSTDQVRWAITGARTPPDARRCSPNSTLVAVPAMVSAGLRVAAVVALVDLDRAER